MLSMDYKVSEMFSRYSRKDRVQSVYCYYDTDIYINNLGIKDSMLLNEVEADLTRLRLTELDACTLNGRFSVTHLQNIHKYIFQDIYPFAGKIRIEEIWKGDTFFVDQTIF